MQEVHLSLRIPNEYVGKTGKEDMLLDLPISYAEGLAEVLSDACNRFYTDAIKIKQSEVNDGYTD